MGVASVIIVPTSSTISVEKIGEPEDKAIEEFSGELSPFLAFTDAPPGVSKHHNPTRVSTRVAKQRSTKSS